jgi:hypothetical protein
MIYWRGQSMINIKKILCEVIADGGEDVRVKDVVVYLVFVALVLCCTLFVVSLIGCNVIETYNNGCINIHSADGMPIMQLLTFNNIGVGATVISLFIIILCVLYKILNMKIVSCDLKGDK